MEDKGYLPKFKWGNLNTLPKLKTYYDFISGETILTFKNKLPIKEKLYRTLVLTWQIKTSIKELFPFNRTPFYLNLMMIQRFCQFSLSTDFIRAVNLAYLHRNMVSKWITNARVLQKPGLIDRRAEIVLEHKAVTNCDLRNAYNCLHTLNYEIPFGMKEVLVKTKIKHNDWKGEKKPDPHTLLNYENVCYSNSKPWKNILFFRPPQNPS